MKRAPFASLILLLLLLLLAWPFGCVEFSPFETDLDVHEREQTRKQLERLSRMPPPSGPWKFAVVSDSHAGIGALARVVRVLNARDDLAFVAHLGDMSNLGLRAEFREALEELQSLKVPFVTVLGNHDTLSNGKDVYRAMFGDFDYTFDYGGIRFVCVNANRREFPGESVPDVDWLAQASAPSHEVAGVIALSHQTLKRPHHLEVLARNGVLAAISGHTHRFALTADQGVLLAVTATAMERAWLLIQVDGTQISVSQCTDSACTPVEAREPEPEQDEEAA